MKERIEGRNNFWTMEMDERLRSHVAAGAPYEQVAKAMSAEFGRKISRYAIGGRLQRLRDGVRYVGALTDAELGLLVRYAQRGYSIGKTARMLGRSVASIGGHAARQGISFHSQSRESGPPIADFHDDAWRERSAEGTRKLGVLLRKHHPEIFAATSHG